MLAINLDCHSEEELQPSVPDAVWAQDKPFYPGWTSEDEVLSIISMEWLTWERPALQTLMSPMDRMPDLQRPVDADVPLSLNSWAYLPWTSCYYTLLHVTTRYYTLLHNNYT